MRPAAEAPAAAEAPVRDAATILLVREAADGPRVLMGQRGARAAFMPDKFVFPGGAVDPDDAAVLPDRPLDPGTERRLGIDASAGIARALPITAIRELWEETGLRLGRPAAIGERVTGNWTGFGEDAVVPHTAVLRLMFRAVTPPRRPRRFDARFFLAPATAVLGDPDDFSRADGELRALRWICLDEARNLPLPFVTQVVLSELEARLSADDMDRPVPYFYHKPAGSRFRHL